MNLNKKIIGQMYMPQIARSYGDRSLETIAKNLDLMHSKCNFTGVYPIALWKSDVDNGFGVVDYSVDPKYISDGFDLIEFIVMAHTLGIEVGVDVVPNHVSASHELAQKCLAGVPGYEDVLYVVSRKEAERLTAAGVPSLFGKEAYSEVEGFKGQDKFVRNTFCNGKQLNLNWNSLVVQDYFRRVFEMLDKIGVDFVRVDCSILLHEDVTKANPDYLLACINAEKSVKAIRAVAGDMPLYHEWFGGPFSPDILNDDPLSFALDCSYVLSNEQPSEWTHPKLVPLLGGHDQMPLANRVKLQKGLKRNDVLAAAANAPSGIMFTDLATWFNYAVPENEMAPTEEDKLFDADINNKNLRYLGRRKLPDIIYDSVGFGW